MKPKVSIIFPTLNGWQDTQECLESITKLDYPKEKIAIIVVDNGSTDKTVPLIKQYFPQVKLFPKKKNLGFAKAVNLGIKKSKCEYLLISNNDVIFAKDYLLNLVNFLEENPGVGIVGGRIYYKQPKKKIAFSGAKFNFYTGTLKLGPTPNEISETDWVSGCNLFIRRRVLKKIGNFDEKFFFYFEDLDLCLRTKKAGYKVIYYPRAIQWHDEGAAISQGKWQKKSEYYYYGKTRILFKYATKIQLISALLFQFLLGLPFHLLILKHNNYPAAIKALVNNLKKQP